jgi:hypothetical protein
LPPRLSGFGGKGIRTPDLLIANETLYQLSYTPELRGKSIEVERDSSSEKDQLKPVLGSKDTGKTQNKRGTTETLRPRYLSQDRHVIGAAIVLARLTAQFGGVRLLRQAK